MKLNTVAQKWALRYTALHSQDDGTERMEEIEWTNVLLCEPGNSVHNGTGSSGMLKNNGINRGENEVF